MGIEKVPPGRAIKKGATVTGKRARMSFKGRWMLSPVCAGTGGGGGGAVATARVSKGTGSAGQGGAG
ncbi:MAG TPA: hypothetical protein VH619_15960 [Verrucomicrobiae bacterium]|nr:hypothetical protein [Verrucomicrobiae bacterium]